MWDYSDDYREAHHVEETPHGIFRAKVMLDEYPEQPEHDFGCPIIQLDTSRYYGTGVEITKYGSESYKHDGIGHGGEYVLERFIEAYGANDGVEVFDRYLRIFHGGSAVAWSSYGYTDYIYVTYDTRAMREFWGCTGDNLEHTGPEMAEWRHWVEGEVYGIDVERAVSFDDDGEPDMWDSLDHSCWGFYGEEYAKEEALSQLKWAIEHTAGEMLPIAN